MAGGTVFHHDMPALSSENEAWLAFLQEGLLQHQKKAAPLNPCAERNGMPQADILKEMWAVDRIQNPFTRKALIQTLDTWGLSRQRAA